MTLTRLLKCSSLPGDYEPVEASHYDRPKLLGELLVEHNLLNEEELEQVLAEQRLSGRRLGEIAVSLGLLSSPALTAVLAEQIGIPLETESGFGSGLWVEIARRHHRGLPVARTEAAPSAEPRLELVDPAPSPEEGVPDLTAELDVLVAAHERLERELAETRLDLRLAEEALEQELSRSAPTFVVHLRLESGPVILRPSGELVEGGAGVDRSSPIDRAAALFAEQAPMDPRRIASAPPQDPVFGLRHENLADRLTRSNWREKAILRVLADGRLLYVWVTRAAEGYRVNVRDEQSFEAVFPRLAEGLCYANGTRGELGRLTRPVAREAWPPEHDVLVLCFPVVGGGDKPRA
jgi:hypothetical protein